MTTIPDWIKKVKGLELAVIQDASLSLARVANTNYNSGGKTPVDTGFLINSIKAAIDTLPAGQNKKPVGFRAADWDEGAVLAVINSMKLGDVLFIGWTAEYAPYMENRFMFARSAAQQWPEIVDKSVVKVKYD